MKKETSSTHDHITIKSTKQIRAIHSIVPPTPNTPHSPLMPSSLLPILAVPQLPANNHSILSIMNDEEVAAAVGIKRDAESPLTSNRPKKPRDQRLRDCFHITPIEGGGEKISCKHCPDYNKTLQKFNPTKGRQHLTDQCPGVDDVLRKILLDTTQAAKKSQNEAAVEAGALASPVAVVGTSTTVASVGNKKTKGRNRPSPAYISIHTDDTKLDVTAPIQNGEQILRLQFPTELKLNFNAEKNTEGAALCIDGFMNMRSDASWTASLCSMSSEGTLAGPHCQWSLNPDITSGVFEGGMTRVQKVSQLLKTLVTN